MSIRNAEIAHIKSVQEKYTERLMAKPHVLGVSLGQDETDDYGVGKLVIVVLVDRKVPDHQLALVDRIPSSLEGIPVIVREIGTIEAF